MSTTVVVSYWFLAGAGLVCGGGLALLPVLWLYRRLNITLSQR